MEEDLVVVHAPIAAGTFTNRGSGPCADNDAGLFCVVVHAPIAMWDGSGPRADSYVGHFLDSR